MLPVKHPKPLPDSLLDLVTWGWVVQQGDLTLFCFFNLNHSWEHLGRKCCKTLTAFSLKSSRAVAGEVSVHPKTPLPALLKPFSPGAEFCTLEFFKVSEVTLSLGCVFTDYSVARACCTPGFGRGERKASFVPLPLWCGGEQGPLG